MKAAITALTRLLALALMPLPQRSQKVFDEYDKDKSGKVSLDEFTKKLHERKQKAAVRPGEKSSLEQRKAQEEFPFLICRRAHSARWTRTEMVRWSLRNC